MSSENEDLILVMSKNTTTTGLLVLSLRQVCTRLGVVGLEVRTTHTSSSSTRERGCREEEEKEAAEHKKAKSGLAKPSFLRLVRPCM